MLRSTLSLLSISGLLVSLVDPAQAGSVTWLAPSQGDVYNSGDTIVGRWTSDEPVPSPSFRLCVTGLSRRSDDDDNGDDSEDDGSVGGVSQGIDDNGSCGGDVWPTIEESDPDGSYLIHMALPNVTSTVAGCYLEMVDDNDKKSSSPTFSFGPSDADGDDQSAANADQADSTDTAADSPASSLAPSPSSASPAKASVPSSSSPSSATASISNANLQSTSSQTPASLNETRMPAPTAAYAVPLSLVLSVLLAAGGLSLHHRRKLRAERKLEEEALKTRATLSRHSTLSFGGFMALGRGPPPHHGGGGTHSRTTSVNMMRAWRRDVSQYDHDRDASRTHTLADDDAHSVLSRSSLGSRSSRSSLPKRREPRPQTREPFYTSASSRPAQRRRPTVTVPAVLFRAGLSPRVPHPDDEDEKPLPSASAGGKHVLEDDDDDVNASVNDGVMSRYFEFSPIPLSPLAPRADTSHVSIPERLHVRRYAENAEYDKALPPSPRVAGRDLYDAVARRLTRK
ncbi:hypothetical protein L226DRAFT_1005 [Lentinus tigrinus ALCF2SS1-7]|uniref:uncharacterized protein n=1 Tax=Lentinus tigrinus ALCF2SS1-7 TaxID=1328758 RepID=UPI001165D432|nr:hypothetical protein L226DRAFT_1005 [Lentinus tigrinus ALCF2SS1-7]